MYDEDELYYDEEAQAMVEEGYLEELFKKFKQF